MSSKKFSQSLSDVVPKQDPLIVRHYAEHLKDLGLSDGKIAIMTGTARHIAVWLTADGQGLDGLDVRLLDRFMHHACHCPNQGLVGRRPGKWCRPHAVRFLRYLLETGRAEVPPQIESGRHLAMQFRDFLEEQGYARSVIELNENLCRHAIVWLYLSGIPLSATDARILGRFLVHDCACVHPGFLDNRPRRFAGSDSSRSMLRLFAAFLTDRHVIPTSKVPQRSMKRAEHLCAFLHWL